MCSANILVESPTLLHNRIFTIANSMANEQVTYRDAWNARSLSILNGLLALPRAGPAPNDKSRKL